ncbi:hypothetical protein CROQUDRAFT_45475, partial [Cronartium quercuum f. sp. fusiforme G11]
AWLSECLARPGVPSPILRVRCLALGPFTPDDLESSTEDGTSEAQLSTIPPNMLRSGQYQLIFLLDMILPLLKSLNTSCTSTGIAPLIHKPELGSQNLDIQVSFYDPAFRKSDKAYLRELGHVVHDEEQNLACDETTFFYIPHGPMSLYAKLLQENYCSSKLKGLGNLLLFGNHLTNYLDQPPRGKKDSSLSLMATILENRQLASDYPPKEVKAREGGPPVFNDMCLQWFPRKP